MVAIILVLTGVFFLVRNMVVGLCGKMKPLRAVEKRVELPSFYIAIMSTGCRQGPGVFRYERY